MGVGGWGGFFFSRKCVRSHLAQGKKWDDTTKPRIHMRHAWDTDDEDTEAVPHQRGIHAWDDVVGVSDDEGSGDDGPDNPYDDLDDDLNPMSNREAAESEILDDLTTMLQMSQITAATFCIMCFNCAMLGGTGLKKYGRRRGLQTGKYQRHLDKVCNFTEEKEREYIVKSPGHPRNEIGRVEMLLPMRLGHEELEREYQEHPEMRVKLRERIEDENLPKAYFDHPLVLANPGEDVLPLGLWMDGLPYSLIDSATAIWLINLITGRRHVLAIIRKRICCKCGCGGWDTYYPVFCVLRWIFECLAAGLNPWFRHDGTEFWPEELVRRMAAGTMLTFKACLIWMKLDWAELCQRVGLPSWSSLTRPCACCNAFGAGRYLADGVSFFGLPWHVNADHEYFDAAARCEIIVVLSGGTHAEIAPRLQYDKRQHGNRGLCLTQHFDGLGLRKGDRLEATPTMQNVAEFFLITAFPTTATFWRRGLEDIVLRRFPMWDEALGITPNRVIAFDIMHSLFLGSMQEWCKWILWNFLSSPTFTQGEGTASERILVALLRVRTELVSFYPGWHREHPDRRLTQVGDLTPKMVGTVEIRKLKLKALETYGFCIFLLTMLEKHGQHIAVDVQRAIESGRTLLEYVRILKTAAERSVNLTDEEHEAMELL